jgi:hypothetical protein
MNLVQCEQPPIAPRVRTYRTRFSVTDRRTIGNGKPMPRKPAKVERGGNVVLF